MDRLVVATRNQGKLREIAELLSGLGLEVESLDSYPDAPDVDEPFDTFVQNAARKALVIAQSVGQWAVADDSGLEVRALNGAPGVNSARVAATDPERIDWVLGQMAQIAPDARQARFVCAVVLASPDGVKGQWQETVEGTITTSPAGDQGFGFDPVFFYPPAGRTFAEMTQEEKSAVSHRGKALRAFRRAFGDIVREDAPGGV